MLSVALFGAIYGLFFAVNAIRTRFKIEGLVVLVLKMQLPCVFFDNAIGYIAMLYS